MINMNKLYPPLTALTVYGKLFVEGYKAEKPTQQINDIMKDRKSLQEWQASKVRYLVQEDSKQELGMIIIKHGNHLCVVDSLVYNEMLSKGIDISHLSDRIEVVIIPTNSGVFAKCTDIEKQIKLKPIQEEEMYKERRDYSIRDIKEKFTITRKQP